jgi:hypothetical protein
MYFSLVTLGNWLSIRSCVCHIVISNPMLTKLSEVQGRAVQWYSGKWYSGIAVQRYSGTVFMLIVIKIYKVLQ